MLEYPKIHIFCLFSPGSVWKFYQISSLLVFTLEIFMTQRFLLGEVSLPSAQNQTNLLSGALFSCRSAGRPVPCFVSDSFSLCIIPFYLSFFTHTFFSHILPSLLSVPPTLIIPTLCELKDPKCLFRTVLFICLCYIVWYGRYIRLHSLQL